MENLIMVCIECQGHGRICLDDYINLNVTCSWCGGKRAMVYTGKQLLSHLSLLEAWLRRTKLTVSMQSNGDVGGRSITVFIKGPLFECRARGSDLDETMAAALDNATEVFLSTQASEAA